MGFWRAIYYYMDWVYIGEKEQKQVERQRHLKYLMCQQIEKSDIKLNKIIKVPYYKPKSKKKIKK